MKLRTLVLVVASLVGCSSDTSPGAGGNSGSGGGGSGTPGGSGDTSSGNGGGGSGSGSVSVTGNGGGGTGSVSVTGNGGGGTGSVGMTGSGTGTGATSGSGSGSGATSGSGSGSGAGSGATSGTGGGSGTSGGGSAPSVPLTSLTAPKMRVTHNFNTGDADPAEMQSNCATGCGSRPQVAALNPKAKTMVGKLVIPLGGAGGVDGGLGGGGNFTVARGFHVFGVAYDAWAAIIPAPNAGWYGNVRLEEFDGMDHTGGAMGLHPQDGVATRVKMGLTWLQKNYPTEAWGYFLAADGSVRWQDVIFTGQSHGGSSCAYYAYLVGASRSVSSSGPRDNMCNSLACNQGEAVASWFTQTPKTPITQFYGISGAQDAQHTQHFFAWAKMGLPGTPQEADGAQGPFTTHRFTSASQGHFDFCGDAAYAAVCNYMFGVPSENAAGVN